MIFNIHLLELAKFYLSKYTDIETCCLLFFKVISVEFVPDSRSRFWILFFELVLICNLTYCVLKDLIFISRFIFYCYVCIKLLHILHIFITKIHAMCNFYVIKDPYTIKVYSKLIKNI